MKSRISWGIATMMLLAAVLVSSSAHAQTTNSGSTGDTSGTGSSYSTTGTNGTSSSTGTTGTDVSGSINSSGSVTPGVPNTGVGGSLAMNLMLLTMTGALALAGLAYVSRAVYS